MTNKSQVGVHGSEELANLPEKQKDKFREKVLPEPL